MKNITLFSSTTRLLLCAICLALLSPTTTFAQSAEQYLEQAYEAPPASKEQFDLYMKAAKLGNAEAMYEVGGSYHYGKGVQEDYKMAERYYLRAAYKGYGQAYSELAFLYQYSLDNKNEAIYWYKKYVDYTYAEKGEPSSAALESLRELGVYYHPGDNSASSNPQQTQTQTQTQQQAYTPEYGYRDVWVKCMTCGGSGQCQVCYGRGGYYSGNYFIMCGGCNGTKVCPVCGGRGGYNETQQYQIR